MTEAPVIPCDADGLAISDTYQAVPHKWAALPFTTRQKLSLAYIDRITRELAKKPRAYRPGHKTFSTQYAIEWGKKQGFGRIVDRERWDGQRSHDAPLGMDVIFEDPVTYQLTGIQGAGRYQRAEHWERFCQRGGTDRAKARNMRIAYLEFTRGNKTPEVIEWWV